MSPVELECFSKRLGSVGWILEYGSGGSTVLATKFPFLKIFTVENDSNWLRELSREFSIAAAVKSGRLILHHVDLGPTIKWGYPVDPTSRERWPNYFRSPWLRGDVNPDLILVDGRFRVACAIESILHMQRECSLVIHDYRSRPHYHIVEKFYEVIEEHEDISIFRPLATFNRDEARNEIESHKFDPR